MIDLAQAIVVIGILALAFWRRDIFLYMVAGPVAIAIGFAWYDYYPTPAGYVLTGALMALGGYCLALAITNIIGRLK
jgi:hypothetical protein